VLMPFRFGKTTLVFGWFLILVGIGYLAIGVRDALGGIAGSLPRMLVGLVAVVVGSSIVRWARRARSE
jgi:xanthosine utilization system XapX-like protein